MASKNDESMVNDVPSTDQGVELQAEIEEIAKTSRHPRLSKREILVLIQGKNMAESLMKKRKDRSNTISSSNQTEPKWEVVSSFCNKNGIKMKAVQCQKRWSKLMVIFRKIKTKESIINEEAESFWNMTATKRRELKLPGFFDKDVYDALDGKFCATSITLNQDIAYVEATDGQWEENDDTNDENPSKELQVAINDPTKKLSSLEEKKELINCEEEATTKESYKNRKFFNNESDQEFDMESQLIHEATSQSHDKLKTNFETNNAIEKTKGKKNALIADLNKIGDALERIAEKL